MIASGRQWNSWIHIDDVVGIYVLAIDRAEGALNATAPEPVRNVTLLGRSRRHCTGLPSSRCRPSRFAPSSVKVQASSQPASASSPNARYRSATPLNIRKSPPPCHPERGRRTKDEQRVLVRSLRYDEFHENTFASRHVDARDSESAQRLAIPGVYDRPRLSRRGGAHSTTRRRPQDPADAGQGLLYLRRLATVKAWYQAHLKGASELQQPGMEKTEDAFLVGTAGNGVVIMIQSFKGKTWILIGPPA